MKLIYGTNNQSKLASMTEMLQDLNLDIVGLNSLKLNLVEPEEPGKEPIENAKIKALSYYNQIKEPVFSADSGLFFEEVTDEDQPGCFIKRIHGKNLSGTEFRDYYANLAKKYGGRLTAYYKNAICLVIDENHVYEYDGLDITSEKFYIVDKPHSNFNEGFPLDSLSVNIKTGLYYNDMETYEQKGAYYKGFSGFFERSLNDLNT